MRDELVKVLVDVALALSPVVTALLGYLALKLKDLIAAKTKNEFLRNVLTRLNDKVFVEVQAMQQLVVDDLKAANADGVLTAEEKAKVKQDVIDALKKHLGVAGIREVLEVLGVGTDTLDAFLGSRIEAAVKDLKSSNPS